MIYILEQKDNRCTGMLGPLKSVGVNKEGRVGYRRQT